MRQPITARPSEVDSNLAEVVSIPDIPAVFLLHASQGKPYLARTSLLRRRLRRLISNRTRVSAVLNLSGIVERIEYWPTGSQLDAALIHLELAQKYFPEEWRRVTHLRPPAFVKLTVDNPFPRTLITTKLNRGSFFGPFPSRGAAEHFEQGLLDLFQIRRCEENLNPSPDHPGCIYGEMNRCTRPCQQAVSVDEYRNEAARVEQFLQTGGASLLEVATAARDRASAEMLFEEAERLHGRVSRIEDVQGRIGPLGHSLDRLAGVAVTPCAEFGYVDLWFLIRGSWQEPVQLPLSEKDGAGKSMDHRLREIVNGLSQTSEPNPEHLSILVRWHGSSWRDGEWIGFESVEKMPYRKLVNAIGRVASKLHGKNLDATVKWRRQG